MKYVLIINPAARSGKSKESLPKIKSFFKRKGLKLEVQKTKKKTDGKNLAKKAAKSGAKVVIAAGGDGTINEVVNGIAGTSSSLGIIPLGTANVFAMELNIPEDTIMACKHIIGREAKTIDIGNVNGHYFISWAGIGLHSHMIKDTEKAPRLKMALGALAYPITGLKTFFTYTPSRMSVNVDSKHYHGYFVLVGNIKYYGGKFKVLPAASSNDGLLDVCIFKKRSMLDNFKYTIAASIGKHIAYEDVDYLQAKKLTIDSFNPALIHADAELISRTPARITVKKKYLKLIY